MKKEKYTEFFHSLAEQMEDNMDSIDADNIESDE